MFEFDLRFGGLLCLCLDTVFVCYGFTIVIYVLSVVWCHLLGFRDGVFVVGCDRWCMLMLVSFYQFSFSYYFDLFNWGFWVWLVC